MSAPDPETVRAMNATAAEPLLPAEKRLIAGSLILGVALLGVLLWLCKTYFPAG